jgi:beta-glucosidase
MPAMSAAPYQDPSQPIEDRVGDLLARMTPEEKVGQLVQGFAQPKDEAALFAAARAGKLGSRILGTTNLAGSGNERTVVMQSLVELHRAGKESRLGIPVITGRDVIHGHRTVFPIPLAQAATWDPDLAERAAGVAAEEARAEGVHWTFAPMVDVTRDPRWGRVIEGGGEDARLTGAMGAAGVRGFQGRSPAELRDGRHMLACVKHFAGYGAPLGGRDYNTCEISPTTLRNQYLPAYHACVEAGAWSVMSGFHDLDGESVSGSRRLLTGVLKQEWGFRGFVVSDWGSVEHLVAHRVAEDRRDAARQSFLAGVDMDMCTNTYADHVGALVQAGAIPRERLDDGVGRILAAKFAAGLFEAPAPDAAASAAVQLKPASRALARLMAARGAVLLKNERDRLPLPKEGYRLALVGSFIDERRSLLGSWTLDGRAEDAATIAEAVAEAAPKLTVLKASGAEDVSRVVQQCDIAVVVVGEPFQRTGENGCVADIVLPPGDEETVRRVLSHGKPTILVVCAGRPLAIPTHVDAILWAWHGGTEAAHAVADVLFGDAEPGGRLPITIPRCTGQIPVFYNRKSTGQHWPGAGWYTDFNDQPLFHFGFGLGYTTWEFRELLVESAGAGARVSCTVANAGRRQGATIVQCYVQDCVASITRPVRELAGWRRVELPPGGTARIAFDLGPAELGFHGIDGTFRVEPGRFQVWVGGDSRADLGGEFRLS